MVFRPNAHLSSIIRPDDENFPPGLQSVSRSFELLSVASVRTSQQHVQKPFSVRQLKGFLFKTQIWEDSYNRPNVLVFHPDAILDKASRAEDIQSSRRSDLIVEIACSRSATVRTLGQHHPNPALFKKEFQRIWKAGCTVIPLDALSYRPDAA